MCFVKFKSSLPLPAACPVVDNCLCISEIQSDVPPDIANTEGLLDKAEEKEILTYPARKRNCRKIIPLVESEVRRSVRIQAINSGYKQQASCPSRRCKSCEPPILSTKVIRNLGKQFCSMADADLTDDKLLEKKGKKGAIGKKKKSESTDGVPSGSSKSKKGKQLQEEPGKDAEKRKGPKSH